MSLSRTEQLEALLKDEPRFRMEQITRALFLPHYNSFSMITTLPQAIKEQLDKTVPWLSCSPFKVIESAAHDTFKAILETDDKKCFETVLMRNRRGEWTLCVSSQIGCAMQCSFCATGTMGLTRSLTADEIIDQYRFWQRFLFCNPTLPQRISNVVFMGMGEPLANYESVKTALHTWLAYTDLGGTRITVSSVGIIAQLNRLLTDKAWPPVRIAISLHSPDPDNRKKIVPTTIPHFHEKLAEWSHAYARRFHSKRQYITFEYTLISGINDTPAHAQELVRYIKKTSARKINVIPYNPVAGKRFIRSDATRIDAFKEIIRDAGVTVTQRKTMGDDIAAACGQLVLGTSQPLHEKPLSDNN